MTTISNLQSTCESQEGKTENEDKKKKIGEENDNTKEAKKTRK